MVSGPSYKRLGTNTDGLLFKYKLAKALTIVSLLAVIVMALGSLVYPASRWNMTTDDSNVNELEMASPSTVDDPSTVVADPECQLPPELFIAKSQDGSYTPPHPDPTLLQAIKLAAPGDVDNYCRNTYDRTNGFVDTVPYNVNGECGNWQQQYHTLHQQRLKQLEMMQNGQLDALTEPPRFISYLCREVATVGNRGCGGLADRMSGMISTFFYALLTDRAYLAHWADENPIPLEILFEKPNIDWTYDPSKVPALFNHPERGITYQQVDTLNQKYEVLGNTMFPDGPTQDFQDLWNGTFVEARSNRAYIIRTFKESSIYPETLAKMGLDKENTFGCLTDYLFRPTIGSRRFINAYRDLFQMNSVLSIGMQVRTDDNALANPQLDHNSLEMWDYYLTCANQVASVQRRPHHKRVVYFMITDSLRLRDEFKSLNTNTTLAKQFLGQYFDETSTVVTGLPVEHIEPEQVEKYIHVENPVEVTRERMTPGVNSAVIENWLLSYADFRIISPQGYGKLAAFHSRSDNSTISLPRNAQKHRAPDCTKPEALAKYDWLATQWSLG
ncbi:hypothetical protein K492DRAFT_229934 [Lichtheimia hyalospora FSU 10163]|nr:hypothetical protein K492DRAFT_229934 [Lichtheimia hyalospora FSU 10163]